MFTIKIFLLSGKGIITDAIVDSLPDKYSIEEVNFSSEELEEVIQAEQENLSTADLVILNLSDLNGVSITKLPVVNELYQNFPVIVLHHYDQKTFADAFLKMGVKAYLPINFYTEDLVAAIEHILSKKKCKINL